MKFFKNKCIRCKVKMIVMASSTAALLMASAGFILNDLITYRAVLMKEFATRAQIIGNNSTAALSFGDSKPVEEILSALSADKRLVLAAVYDANGNLFAAYRRSGSDEVVPANPDSDHEGFAHDHLDLTRDIMFNGQRVGAVYLHADLVELRSRMLVKAGITGLLMLASIGVAFLLSVPLQRVISVPIYALATVVNRVKKEKDYSFRATKQTDDELGQLVEGFNEMLEQIQQRDSALHQAQVELEQRVELRTKELREANEKLNCEIEERKRTQAEVEAMQSRLMEASREAGMAEVATGVLHNVGNVLNSVNVSASVLQDRLRESKLGRLEDAAKLLKEHESDLNRYLAEDPKGRLLPGFLVKLSGHLAAERDETRKELALLVRNIEHIKEIVSMQQNYAKVSGVSELLSPIQVVEDVLGMNETGFGRHGIAVSREFDEVPVMSMDKHKVMQIVVNLVRNAKHALIASSSEQKRMTVRVKQRTPGEVAIEVEDNGVGIAPENLTKIFGHGFTTKKDGHGFGLHSGALAAREMGGSLQVFSEGSGLGAKFCLTLPVRSAAGSLKAA